MDRKEEIIGSSAILHAVVDEKTEQAFTYIIPPIKDLDYCELIMFLSIPADVYRRSINARGSNDTGRTQRCFG